MEKYKYWDVYNELPEGWMLDKSIWIGGDFSFITNGKSPLKGQKRAVLMLKKEHEKINDTDIVKPLNDLKKEPILEAEEKEFPAETVNALARAKFKEKLLQEILFDFMVCELEHWNKKEYIEELKELIDGIYNKFGVKK